MRGLFRRGACSRLSARANAPVSRSITACSFPCGASMSYRTVILPFVGFISTCLTPSSNSSPRVRRMIRTRCSCSRSSVTVGDTFRRSHGHFIRIRPGVHDLIWQVLIASSIAVMRSLYPATPRAPGTECATAARDDEISSNTIVRGTDLMSTAGAGICSRQASGPEHIAGADPGSGTGFIYHDAVQIAPPSAALGSTF